MATAKLRLAGAGCFPCRRPALTLKQRESCYHEAGHAVAAHLVGAEIEGAEIEPEPNFCYRNEPPIAPRDEAFLLVAGSIAHGYFRWQSMGEAERAQAGSDEKLERALLNCQADADKIPPTIDARDLAAIFSDARVKILKNWGAVQRVAALLENERSVQDPAEILAAIRGEVKKAAPAGDERERLALANLRLAGASRLDIPGGAARELALAKLRLAGAGR